MASSKLMKGVLLCEAYSPLAGSEATAPGFDAARSGSIPGTGVMFNAW